MTKKYLGLVVGGPADGHRIVNDSTRLVVEEKPRPSVLGVALIGIAPPDIPVVIEPVRFVYQWTDCGPIALWLPEGSTLEHAQKQMADTIGIVALADRYEQIIARRKDDARHG